MKIDERWEEMEREARTTSKGWLSRFALPQVACPLLIALKVEGGRRALLLQVPHVLIPPKKTWPDCDGLEIFAILISDQSYIGVSLKDQDARDVFTVLAEDLAPKVAVAANQETAIGVLLGRLRRWQKFLAAGARGLNAVRQRALYGELHTLKVRLFPLLGEAAVLGWHAPQASHQDFQFRNGAVEVKTTSAKQPQAVRITSERQLDTTGIPALFLHVVVVDEREVEGLEASSPSTLPGLIGQIRSGLGENAIALEALEDGLLDMGYLDSDAHRYLAKQFSVRSELTFQIVEGFPRITERQLPLGIGDVAYDLDLVACKPHTVAWDEIAANLLKPSQGT
jgi:hypothetical protein